MQNNTVSKQTVSFGVSLALCSVVNALLVVVKEKSPAWSECMKKMTGHHWVTHGAIVMLLFFVCGWVLALPNGGNGLRMASNRLLGVIVGGVITGGLIIMGFYTFAD